MSSPEFQPNMIQRFGNTNRSATAPTIANPPDTNATVGSAESIDCGRTPESKRPSDPTQPAEPMPRVSNRNIETLGFRKFSSSPFRFLCNKS